LKTEISQKNHVARIEYYCNNIKQISEELVLFTDEASFDLYRNTIKEFKFKSEAKPNKIKLSQSVTQMIWAGVSTEGKTQIYFVDGWLNEDRYLNLLKQARKDIVNIFDKTTLLVIPQTNAFLTLKDTFLRMSKNMLDNILILNPSRKYGQF
jgi:hypothetical protein